MGIKRKIVIGFISIGTLLFLSGIISTFELVRFNRATAVILERSRSTIELSKDMLDAVQEQNTALLMSVTDSLTSTYDSIIEASRVEFNRAFTQARITMAGSPKLTQLAQANDYYNSIVAQINDTVTIDWFSKVYKTSYFNLTHSIKEFMVAAQGQIIEFTAELEESAYRATMVGIIALAAGLLLIVMFYFMINHFVIYPTLEIQRGLHKHLNSRIPFDVPITTNDELLTLKQDISQLIEHSRK